MTSADKKGLVRETHVSPQCFKTCQSSLFMPEGPRLGCFNLSLQTRTQQQIFNKHKDSRTFILAATDRSSKVKTKLLRLCVRWHRTWTLDCPAVSNLQLYCHEIHTEKRRSPFLKATIMLVPLYSSWDVTISYVKDCFSEWCLAAANLLLRLNLSFPQFHHFLTLFWIHMSCKEFSFTFFSISIVFFFLLL